MSNEIKTFSVEECKRWIDTVSVKTFTSPDDCLKELDMINECFREAMLDKIRFEDISDRMRGLIRELMNYCGPAIDYEIKETSTISQESKVTPNECEIRLNEILGYTLNIKSSSEDIAAQIDAFYSTAIAALSDPLFKKGYYDPQYVLTIMGESCWLETDVKEPEEIERIASKLVKRFFIEIPEDTDNAFLNDKVKDTESVGMLECDGQSLNILNIEGLNTSIKTMRDSVKRYISDKCKYMPHSNPAKISALAQWINLPKFGITVKVSTTAVKIQQAGRKFTLELPERQYLITEKERFSNPLDSVLSIVTEALTNSVMKTSAKLLRRDLENIINLQNDDSKDIRALLKQVICDNFNVDIIEIDNEDDSYATPQYFEVSRSNLVDKPTTTQPAILSKKDGAPILKGHYVVPLAPADTK